MRGLLIALVVAGVFAGLGGCSLLTNLDALSGGGDASDAAGDVLGDVLGDASGDGSDAKTSPCTAVHSFCDDFDHGALGATWDGVVVQSGPLVYSTSNEITPPNSLEATGNATGSPTELVKNFPSADHTHVEFDLMIQNPAVVQNAEVDFITIEATQPPSGIGFADLTFSRLGGTSNLGEYASPVDGGVAARQDLAISEAFGGWRHVALDLVFSAQTLELRIDGTLVQTLHFNPALTASPLKVSVGAAYVSGTSGDWDVFVDDFVVDQQ